MCEEWFIRWDVCVKHCARGFKAAASSPCARGFTGATIAASLAAKHASSQWFTIAN